MRLCVLAVACELPAGCYHLGKTMLFAKERASLLVRARDSFVGGAAPAAGLLGTSESNNQMEEEDDEDDGDHVLAGGGSASSVGEVEAGRI